MIESPRPTTDALLARLAARGVAAAPDLASLAGLGEALALLVEDPARVPEAWDLAVILPEALREVSPPLPAFVLAPDAARAAKASLALERLPALVLLRRGAVAGAIEGLRDWDGYRVALRALRPAAPAPALPAA